ncbi:MAG: hypothetical protein JXQ75_05895 [Phycisphaerae bacterium]|nr:hypothetical protein [Phycisphaerae bacterium]
MVSTEGTNPYLDHRRDDTDHSLLLSDDAQRRPPHEPAADADGNASTASRRFFLGQCARKLAYVAPVALLFRPKQAMAASGGTQVSGL